MSGMTINCIRLYIINIHYKYLHCGGENELCIEPICSKYINEYTDVFTFLDEFEYRYVYNDKGAFALQSEQGKEGKGERSADSRPVRRFRPDVWEARHAAAPLNQLPSKDRRGGCKEQQLGDR